MFDVLVAAEPRNPFSERVTTALRRARLRVVELELAATERPPSGVSFDVAVACAERSAVVDAMARVLRACLDGPPPVVGVTHEPTAVPPGMVDLLADDAASSFIVARVQRAAASRERVRSRTVLSGDLADVGLRALLLSLGSRGRSGTLRVRAMDRRAEFFLDAGRMARAQVHGMPASPPERVMDEVEAWAGAVFDFVGSQPSPSAPVAPAQPRSRAEPVSGSDSDIALAAAVMNAVAAYAGSSLPFALVVRYLEDSRQIACASHFGVGAFTISKGGMVSVTRVSVAREAVPDALGIWCRVFLDMCRPSMPVRFKHVAMSEVLGGLTRLIEKAGWGEMMLRAEKG